MPRRKAINQKDRVMMYMKDFGSITPMEAFKDLGITKLATVVSNLRLRDGIAIVIQREQGVNRYGEPTTYCRYSLPKEEKETKAND